MADFTITGTTSTARTLLNGETGFVALNGAIATSSTAVDAAGSVRIAVMGTIQAFSGFAIDHDGTDIILDIGSGGYVGSSTSDGVSAAVTSSALVTNFGTIQSDADALDLRDSDGSALIRVINHGTISGRSDGMVLQSGTGTTSITNTGTIHGEADGIFNAFSVGQGGTTTLDNSGTITGLSRAYGGDDSTETIRNTGTMIGGIDLEAGDDTYIGTGGTTIGSIRGQAGNDTFDIRGGVVNGTIEGGADNDTYIVDDGNAVLVENVGEGTDEVQVTSNFALGANFENLTLIGAGDATGVGNDLANVLTGNAGWNRLGGSAGNDTILGGQGNDSLYGGGNNDSIDGGEGDDYVSGGSGADSILGDDGDDILFGRRGFDSINGGDGADWIDGGTGGDFLLGGQENDTIIGGEGSDSMNGGAGNDSFVWYSAGESPNTSGRDLINGFEVGLDLIDLRALGIDQINIGGGITGGGTSSLRTFETTGGDTRIFVDVDGNGTQDMRIDLIGATGVTGIDFIV